MSCSPCISADHKCLAPSIWTLQLTWLHQLLTVFVQSHNVLTCLRLVIEAHRRVCKRTNRLDLGLPVAGPRTDAVQQVWSVTGGNATGQVVVLRVLQGEGRK